MEQPRDAGGGRAPRRSRTPSTDVSDSLLAAARDLVESDGHDALTIRAVAGRAGVAPMGVYSRFGSKAGLTEALFVDGFHRLGEQITAASGPDALTRLRAGCAAYRAFATAHPHVYDLMFHHMKTLDLSQTSQQTAIATFGLLADRVTDAMAAGALAADDATEVAQRIWNGLHGAVMLEITGVALTPDPAATFSAMVDTLIAGLAPVAVRSPAPPAPPVG